MANPRIEDGYRTEQNRTLTMWWRDATNLAVQCRERAWFAINDRQTVSVKVNFSELVNTVQRTASWHRDLHIQHTVNEDYDPGIPDAFSIQRSLHWALHNPGICGSGLKNRSGRPKNVTIHHEWRLQSQDTRHIYNPEIAAQAQDLWISIVKVVWSNLDGPKKSPYVIIIHSNNCFCTIFTTAHVADTCTTYIRCIFFTHCHCSSSDKLLHSVRIQATTHTQSCSAKINPMFWHDPVIPARSWENQSGIAIPNYQVQRHSTL